MMGKAKLKYGLKKEFKPALAQFKTNVWFVVKNGPFHLLL